MKRLMTVAIAVATLALAAAAHAAEQKRQCKYSDLYSGNCEKELVRFLQRLDLTAEQKTAIDGIYSTAEQQRKTELARYFDAREDVLSLDPADPEYNYRAAQLAEQKAACVEQNVIHSAAMQAQVYELLTQQQRAAYEQLRTDWIQGHFEQRQRRSGSKRLRPPARSWASSSITF